MEKLLKQLVGRIDILIKLQVLTGLKDWNQGEKIMAMHSIGIAQADIASILGIKLNNVTAAVSREMKKKKRDPVSEGQQT